MPKIFCEIICPDFIIKECPFTLGDCPDIYESTYPVYEFIERYEEEIDKLKAENKELKTMFRKCLNEIENHPTCKNAIYGIVTNFHKELEKV